jgi:hypothetical protein
MYNRSAVNGSGSWFVLLPVYCSALLANEVLSGSRLVAGILIFKLFNFIKMETIISSIYKNLGDNDLIATTFRVLNKMKNNPNFSDPPAELAETEKKLPEFITALGNAKGRDMEAVQLKNNLKAGLVALLVPVADYVTRKCKGDRLMLLSSGFPISDGTTRDEPDPVIQQLEVELGSTGEATTKVKRIGRARIYMHEYTTVTPDSETVWHSELSKSAVYTFNGLKSMEKYWFRVVAISREGQRVISPVVSRVIQ